MFSKQIKTALEREIVGQTTAVNTVVRGITRIVSGLTPRERALCSYLFMGPPGTGKTYLIQTLARILHGDQERVVVADCGDFVHGDPRVALAAQLSPLFSTPPTMGPSAPGSLVEAPPLSIVQIEFLERGPKDFYRVLASALETGQVRLPDGRRGSLRNCLVFLTSELCSGEILDEATQIGFSGSANDDDSDDEDRLYKLCHDSADEQFGSGLVSRLDRLVIFHRLQEEHLSQILDRHSARLNHWLANRRVQCELRPSARDFLIEKGRRNVRFGSRDLLRAHQKFVEFPVADLLISGGVRPGQALLVERRASEDLLHITVDERSRGLTTGEPFLVEIPVS